MFETANKRPIMRQPTTGQALAEQLQAEQLQAEQVQAEQVQADRSPVSVPKPAPIPNDQSSAESRLDPLTGGWTIFAPQRTERPDDFVERKPSIKSDVQCPFCKGNEATTPPAVWTRKIPETVRLLDSHLECINEDWSVRVVPNKFPAVGQPADAAGQTNSASDRSSTSRESQFFRREPIAGGHEVIIESNRHVHSLTQLDMAEIELVFQAYQDRLRHYRELDGIRYTSIFKNVGRSAGASLTHSHSQLVATDRLPRGVENAFERMRRHRAETGCCLRCDIIRAERKAKERIVACDELTVAFCPFASHLPMMVRVTSVGHQSCFEDLRPHEIESVARIVYRVVSWLEKMRPGTAYNYCLNTRPPGVDDPTDSFHWSMDIFPRMTMVAGFEWSSGCMINPVLPETAAAMFRKCAVAEDPRRVVK